MTVEPFDTRKYYVFLDDPALPDERRDEIILIVRQMIESVVDIAFGEDPAQQIGGSQLESITYTDAGELDSRGRKLSEIYKKSAAG